VKALRSLPLLVVIALAAASCSLGEGTGTVTGSLDVPDCWSGPFDLKPDFFAAVPYRDGLVLRIQKGGDYESFSDGLSILVDDVHVVRGDPTSDGTPRQSLLGQSLPVSLPPEVTPPGVPIKVVANPPLVHASLYMQRTCRTQNVALYAMDSVTLNADGTCNRPDGGEPPLPCGAGAPASDGGAPTSDGGTAGGTASSSITFDSLFNGNPDETNAQERLTSARFEFFLADPREVCPGGVGPPPRCRGHLTGDFKFYFQRGKPAQPFP
jgi:hypothetical protein